MKKYYITVERCNDGERGILCDSEGKGYCKSTQHTDEEMNKMLGHFWMVLDPKSECFTKEDFMKIKRWKSLGEYNHQLGIGLSEFKHDRILVVPNLQSKQPVIKDDV